MRLHLLFPLAFLSGIYGFFFFAPYLIAVVAMGHLIQRRRMAMATVAIKQGQSADQAEKGFAALAAV